MEKERLLKIVKKLIASAAKRLECEVSYKSNPDKPSVIEVQPLINNCGTGRELVEKFAQSLNADMHCINISRRVSITPLSTNGSGYNKAFSDNLVHKLRVMILD